MLFVHLLHMLSAVNPNLLHELDERYVVEPIYSLMTVDYCHRYCQVPTFGRDTIRKFRASVSELKKMAARDFEDLLQVFVLISSSNCD